MLRLVCSALLATVVLGTAACGTKAEENPTATTSSSAPATAASSSPEDKKAACAAYQKDWEQLQLRALGTVGDLLSAGQDQAKANKAAEDLKKLLADMQASADKHLATATNPEFKAALSTYAEKLKSQSKAIEAAGTDPMKLVGVMNNDEYQAAVDKLAELCGA